jgi:hypothetical protein
MNRIHALVATSFLLLMANAVFGAADEVEPNYPSIQSRCGHLWLREIPLPRGEGGAQRQVREARPTILNKRYIVGRVALIRRCRATFSRREKDTPPRFFAV